MLTDLTVLEPGVSYKVHVDPNTTYQDYYTGKDCNGGLLMISSDDCVDNKYVTIIEDAGSSYTPPKRPRRAHTNPLGVTAVADVSSSDSGPVSKSLLKMIIIRQ